jgi:dienelactone hydrolase
MDAAAVKATLQDAFEQGQHRLVERDRQLSAHDDLILETLTFEAGGDQAVRGYLWRPAAAMGRLPAILYIHAHGNRYEVGAKELVAGRPAFDRPLAPDLARLGACVFGFDLPCFGSRAGVSESAATKAALWRGRSLAGQMVGELAAGLDWLKARDDVDVSRVGAYGLSMGATFAYWLGAVRPDVAFVAHACCFADLSALIETGAHDLHGIYLTVPGLLTVASNGEIAGLIAPRPQWVGLGADDPLTPLAARERALHELAVAYQDAPERLYVHVEAGLGHRESPAMRASLLGFIARAIGARANGEASG